MHLTEGAAQLAAGGGSKDFFVSYSGADRAWAEWIAWVLEEAEYTVLLQAWDFRPGSNFGSGFIIDLVTVYRRAENAASKGSAASGASTAVASQTVKPGPSK